MENGEWIKATLAFKKLTRAAPGLAPAWMGYGRCALMRGEMSVAEGAWQTARNLEPKNINLLLELGHLFEGLRQPEKAREHFEAAMGADSTAINPRISLALLLEKNNRLAEARQATEGCLALDDGNDQARYVSALLSIRENQIGCAERQLRELIAGGPQHQYVQYAAHYELARILDQTGRFDEAMQELIEAKKRVMALADQKFLIRHYDRIADRQLRGAKELPKDALRRWAKSFPEKLRVAIPPLAFLGGHPRSGTTLLEQILGAHPGVAAIDEPVVTQIALAACKGQVWESPVPRLNLARQNYIASLRQSYDGDADGKILLEKNPSPTSSLPALLRVFPEMRVIIALRDPRDVILSCYFQNFALNEVNANFLSFERLAKHYADLMGVWRTVREWEDLAWMETRYEDVVADVEKEGGKVMKFLGIEWREQQKCFFEQSQKKRVYSPTYDDVRKPVYTRSISRWRCYEKYMARALPVLEPFCRLFGYE